MRSHSKYELQNHLKPQRQKQTHSFTSSVLFVADMGSAVAMLAGIGKIQGVVRFLQLSERRCLIDGTIDGLEPGPHGLHVHALGDLTLDCLRYSCCKLTSNSVMALFVVSTIYDLSFGSMVQFVACQPRTSWALIHFSVMIDKSFIKLSSGRKH